ncbi:class I SAM-dependent methyltransferase [Brevibacterium linens ATCC 9172]|uniref:Methyltransferase domain-containing protein n=2 Tax=Brevibacterium linens TaxID=1703 RepID=A0A2H1JEI8_BRELN|nr:class I SAM-dependent methyltransferase [Brevibacterium linens ATCC 9172]MDN5585752.1 class I SAM-dependent methyltransferase [Brevibacterium sp.]SMX85859.1 Methyltransferase domain-containing protein [Brevibacterium linens ATCC 9172]
MIEHRDAPPQHSTSAENREIRLDRARDEAALASMACMVSELGTAAPEQFAAADGIAAEHRSVAARWISELIAAGFLSDDASQWRITPPSRGDVDALWSQALDLTADQPTGTALTQFFASCWRHLPELLAGEITVHSLLFDGDDITAEIYQSNTASQHVNAETASAVRRRCLQILDEARTPAILEIGAGVGGTTDIILDAVDDLPLTYHFTDIGHAFTHEALSRCAGRSGFTSGVLDINAPLSELQAQLPGLVGDIDIVIAANVMHNARNVQSALSAITELVRTDAEFALIETGTEHLPLLISMRFLMSPPPPGPGIGGDRAETGRILLTAHEWSQALEATGWTVLEVWPGPGSDHPIARYDQHMWHTRRRQEPAQ